MDDIFSIDNVKRCTQCVKNRQYAGNKMSNRMRRGAGKARCKWVAGPSEDGKGGRSKDGKGGRSKRGRSKKGKGGRSSVARCKWAGPAK